MCGIVVAPGWYLGLEAIDESELPELIEDRQAGVRAGLTRENVEIAAEKQVPALLIVLDDG